MTALSSERGATGFQRTQDSTTDEAAGLRFLTLPAQGPQSGAVAVPGTVRDCRALGFRLFIGRGGSTAIGFGTLIEPPPLSRRGPGAAATLALPAWRTGRRWKRGRPASPACARPAATTSARPRGGAGAGSSVSPVA